MEKKRVIRKRISFIFSVLFILIFLFSLSSFVNASSLDDEIQKITNYAEEYETGNINYVQLIIYGAAVRERINNVLGATNKEMGGTLNEEQLRGVFGEPTEKTRWVWVENEQRDEKMEDDIPAWRKIIFDGKKIQLWISAWPNVLIKDGERIIFYRLNIELGFKKPENQIDIESRISEIKGLAENFNSNPARENAELLAQTSVSTERAFESYFRQSNDKCENVMKNIFGSENKRASEKMLAEEIEFYDGGDFVVMARLEMCDECEWHWINLNFWVEGRGPGFRYDESEPEIVFPEQFKDMDNQGFKNEILNIFQKIKQDLEQGKHKEVMDANGRINAVNEAWNQKSNDVWKDVDKVFEEKRKAMSQTQQEEYNRNYGWIRDEQEKRGKVKEIADRNYQERKEFYLNLFSGYKKKEFYFTQEEYEKRLVEEFKEFGEEICNNNQDDNDNNEIDCGEMQCQGKICGKQNVKKKIMEGNETKEIEVVEDLYCIANVCQAKEELIEIKEEVCGNHICGGNENIESCAEDCAICPGYDALQCDGNVIFKGKDEKGCSLEPICIKEDKVCNVNEDCLQPLCGNAECVNNECKTTNIEECREEECVDGEEKSVSCENGDNIIVEKCIESRWRATDVKCEGGLEKEGPQEPVLPVILPVIKPGIGEECIAREDCGNKDDVCSNGRCITIPQAVKVEPGFDGGEEIGEGGEADEEEVVEERGLEEGESEEREESAEPAKENKEGGNQRGERSQEEEKQEQSKETEQTIAGQIIKSIKLTVTGFAIFLTGYEVTETAPEPAPEDDGGGENNGGEQSGETTQQPEQEQPATDMPLDDEGETPIPTEEPQEDKSDEEKREEERRRGEERRGEEENREEERRGEEREREEEARRRDEEKRRDEENKREEERRKNECKERCNWECRDKLVMPCVEKCSRESECKDKSCIDETIKNCESKCKSEKNFDDCVNECGDKCSKGEEWEGEREDENRPKEEKGVFKAGGTCRTSGSKTEGFIFFDGWGEPFENLRFYKQKYYSGGNADWCRDDLENLIKQRKEFENGFNEEFVKWFFEKYLANSAEDWEQHVSGIYEIYWKDVDNSRQIMERLNCLGKEELPEHNLINVKYETEFGKLEFWEELKPAKLPGMEKEANVITPYMKIWIFPPKEFIMYEMGEAMKKHEFPGPKEEKLEGKNQQGITDEEKEMIKQDEDFIERLKEISNKYDGSFDVAVRLVDYDSNKVVFNLYVQANEQDIMKAEPMLPEEVIGEDAKVDIDFKKVYELISISEKDMQGERIEIPPWDKQARPIQKVKEMVNGVRMYFKIRSMVNSAKIEPEESEDDVDFLIDFFLSKMMEGGGGDDEGENRGDNADEEDIINEKEVWDKKEKITGEWVFEKR